MYLTSEQSLLRQNFWGKLLHHNNVYKQNVSEAAKTQVYWDFKKQIAHVQLFLAIKEDFLAKGLSFFRNNFYKSRKS